uniref:Uncharacterized protein n=1 Tax=Tetradesmus obliquus TaxID=3088 RepID=A0A383W436_TETOB|eukprot:jgi/Sobl393_1/20046/SZX71436.1
MEQVLSNLMSHHEDVCVSLLDAWPAAAEALGGDALARLMLASLLRQHGPQCDTQYMCCGGFATKLIEAPAAAKLSSSAVADIIQATFARYSPERHRTCMCAVYLPQAQQLSCKVVGRLLHAAIQQRSSSSMLWLSCLPGMQQLSSSELFDLLQMAVQLSRDVWEADSCKWDSPKVDRYVKHLWVVPAAEELTSNQVARLLQAATQLGSAGCVEILVRLPAAKQLDSGVVGPLLLAAMQQQQQQQQQQLRSVPHLCRHLCSLPGAQQLSRDAVVHLLQTAIANGRLNAVEDACKLPASREISSEVLAQLVEAAVRQDKGGVGALCALPAAQQLTSTFLMQLLQADMQQRGSNILDLCKLPGVQQLGRSPKGRQLLQAAEQQQLCCRRCGRENIICCSR